MYRSGEIIMVGVNPYVLEVDANATLLHPQDGVGDSADSRIDTDDYRYTHGGEIFRLACDLCREIASERQVERY